MGWKYAVRRLLWSVGLDLVKDHPDNSLPSYLRMLFRELDIDCVLDVGGHWGEFGIGLRTFGYKGRIVSFEPVAENFELLQRAAARDARWEVHHMAIGSEEGEAEINVTEGTGFSSFLQPIDRGVKAREPVRVRRLDRIFHDIVPPEQRVFLKLDTQGYDLEVMRGASGILDRIVALVTEMSIIPIYEKSTHYVTAMSEFEKLGFHPSAMYAILNRREHRLMEFDCVMVR